MIKAVFFDWGYVFMQGFRDREREINKILEPLGLDWQKFYSYWKPFYILRSSGEIKSDKDFENMIKMASKKEIPVRKIIEIIIENQWIPKEHIEVVKKLKKKYKVGILSNHVQEWIKKVLKNYKIEKLFDSVTVSSKVGARKPNALIYFEALKKLSVKPEESVFIADEVAEDLVAASGLGIKTIWLKANFRGWWGKNDKKALKIYQPDATIHDLKEVIPVIKKW